MFWQKIKFPPVSTEFTTLPITGLEVLCLLNSANLPCQSDSYGGMLSSKFKSQEVHETKFSLMISYLQCCEFYSHWRQLYLLLKHF